MESNFKKKFLCSFFFFIKKNFVLEKRILCVAL